MNLRTQLLLATLVLLTLPVAVWLVASGIESSLRDLRQQSLEQVARSVADALVATQDVAHFETTGSSLYVNHTRYPFAIDGYDDDWLPWKRWAQSFDASGVASMQLLLSQDDDQLYLLARVHDSSTHRAVLLQDGMEMGDHLQLRFTGRRGLMTLTLLPGAPGSVNMIEHDGRKTDLPLRGVWRELGARNGYLVELAIPRALLNDRLGIAAVDTGSMFQQGADRVGTLANDQLQQWPMMSRQPEWSAFAARLMPDHTRMWIINREGWVMADADRFPDLDQFSQQRPTGWQRLFYRLLSRQSLPALNRDSDFMLRMDPATVDQILAGESVSDWATTESGSGMIATIRMPIRSGERVIGGLIMDQLNDNLLLTTNQTLGKLLLVSLLAVIVAVILIVLYASWLSRRVRRLRDATVLALSSDHPLDVRLPGQSDHDEIGDLSRAFDRLLGDVRDYDDYLKTLASRLSHEISTPLAVVKSSLENLKQEGVAPGARQYVERAQGGADRLQVMIRAMSEARRLEQALQATDPERFDLRDVVQGCFDAYRVMDGAHQWSLNLPEQPIILNGAPELIAQMLDKLTDNARSFTPPEGEIILSVSAGRKSATLTVANDGPCLPVRLRNRLFNSLVSVREADGSAVHMGLGLHIVKLIVRAHGGQVIAQNRKDQKGVEFIVSLVGISSARP